MKLAFLMPPFLVGSRPFDFPNLLSDPRGTTGSEIMILAMAYELAVRGHDVTMFVEKPNAASYRLSPGPGASVDLRDSSLLAGASSFDAVCVSLDPDPLRAVAATALRVVLQQVNDFNYPKKDFDKFVDLYVSPSEPHRERLKAWTPGSEGKWIVIGNGCYPNIYPATPKEPGRCIWASSPDRGLHHVLESWGEIREAVPNATLKIFYFALQGWIDQWRNQKPGQHPFWDEHIRRSKIVERGLNQKGVTVVGSASRNDMAKEFAAAEILAFPTDTIDWTEGFSCSTLEGCASGALPILMECDALKHIYGGSAPMAAKGDVEHWRNLVIRALTVEPWRQGWRQKARALAERFSWPLLAEQLEKTLDAHRKAT